MLPLKVVLPRAKHKMHRLYFYLALVITVSGVSAAKTQACTPPPALQSRIQAHPTSDAYAALGNWYGDRKQYECAGQVFQAGLKRSPRSAELLYFLGLNFMRMNQFDRAVQPLQQSIELKPNVLKPHLLLATALEQLKQPVDARKEWLAAVRIDQHSDMALDGMSKNLLAAGDYESIIGLFGSQPNLSETLVIDLASAYQKSGASDRAVEVLERALRRAPYSLQLANELVRDLVLLNRYQEAAKFAKQLVQDHPDDKSAQKLYLHVLVTNDDDQLARPLASKLLQSDPHDFWVLYLNGVLFNHAGNYAAARPLLAEACGLNPDHYNCHYNLGTALSQLGDLKGAREQFEKALALGALEPQIRFEYAKTLRGLGETKLAAEQLTLYQQAQKDMAARTEVAIKSAQAARELDSGNTDKAVALYRDAVAAQPNNAMLNFRLSVALDKLGDRNGEIEVLKRTVQIDPTMAIAHYQLGYLATLRGDFVLAEEQYRDAVRAAPEYVDAWIGLAATLATESRLKDAQEAVETALKIDPTNANALQLQTQLTTASQVNQ
jgi:tetratricopeptide (TPR) repeat protein